MHSSPNQVVQVQALTRDIVLCFWARHSTLTAPLSTQEYKWVSAIVGETKQIVGSDLQWTSIPSRGSSNTPSLLHATETGISSGSYEPLDSKASLANSHASDFVSYPQATNATSGSQYHTWVKSMSYRLFLIT